MAEGFQLGPWWVDTLQHVLRDGAFEVSLSDNEVGVLVHLAKSPDVPVPREELLQDVLGYASTVDSRALDACLRRLRKKLEKHPSHPQPLQSRRGVGVYLTGVREEEEVPVSAEPPPGREGLIEDVTGRLSGPGLLTLQGPSGIGKTALARFVQQAQGGAWVELASAADVHQLEGAVAATLGTDPDHLEERLPSLLVLDNCEQLEPAAVLRIGELARRTRVLATSIRPLRLDEEQVVPVPLLDRETARGVLASQVERLGGRVRSQNLEALIDTVGGHPLALVLLAPVVGVAKRLAPADLLSLTSDRPGDPDRHQSLSAALDRVRTFVDADALALLDAAAMFQGSFRLDALAAVAGRALSEVVAPMRELVRFGLMESSGDLFRLLPVVRLHTRPADPALDARLLFFLLHVREGEMQEGLSYTAPYRDDLAAAIHRVSDEGWVELLFALDSSGAVPRDVLAAFERGIDAQRLPEGDVVGLRTYVYRLAGVGGDRLEQAEAALRDGPEPTVISLYEQANQLGMSVSAEALSRLAPAEPTPTWVYAVAGLLSHGDPELDRVGLELRARCDELGWWAAVDMLDASFGVVHYARGDAQGAYDVLSGLTYADMHPKCRATLQLAAWEIGARRRARALAERACGFDDVPHNRLAQLAVAAALASLDGDPVATELAEQALEIPGGAGGFGLATIARLVLVRHGRAASTGDPRIDAALAGASYDEHGGVIDRLASWLLAEG